MDCYHGKCLVLNLKSTVLIYRNSLTYPIFILDADISSFLDKAFHCVVMVLSNRNMQRSPLIKE